MEELFSEISLQLRKYFDQLLVRNEAGILSIIDDELNDFASCCTVGEVASFYLADQILNGGKDLGVALELMRDVSGRQLENGSFGQPYFVKKGEAPTVDIAEIGAVANALYHAHKLGGSREAKESLIKSADYLLTQVAKENTGAVYKNPNAIHHDVLNGDVYAAHTFGRAFQLTGREIYRKKAEDIMRHVSSRFGKHSRGWWPYIENWDGSVGMGNSVSYQGTIIAFGYTCKTIISEKLKKEWDIIETEALETMANAMQLPPNDATEAPWWCRDWENAWEIYLSYWRKKDKENYYKKVVERFARLSEALKLEGGRTFSPKTINVDQDRSPVTTTFRKAATFAGIFSYMILDESISYLH